MDSVKKVPEIRFKGFDEELKEAVLADVAKIYDGTHQTPKYKNHGIMFLSVEDIKTLKSSKFISKDDFIKDFDIYPERGDILMTRIGDIGTSNVVDTDETLAYYVSLALIKPFDISCYYLNYLISSNLFRKELNNRTLSTAIPKKINMGEIGKINFYKPISKEQTQIGSFFKNLDEKLEIEKEKHEKLINFKKAMLEDMFPKEGEKVPKVRFEGFDGEWADSQLKDLGQKYTSLTGKTKNDFGHGDGRYVTFSNVLANPVSSLDGVDKIEVDNSQNTIRFGDLFFNISSETYDEVGMSSVWNYDVENYYLNSFCMGFRPSVNMDNHFITYLLRSRSVRKQIMKLAQGISRINISQTKMMDIFLCMPSLEEQALIGNFFKNLDEKIELSEKKIEKIENFKKAMLDKMFV